tara:strand:- start:1903 stop:3876 length:1974 start_codon:yes stop_codon:yes gene_type:complete
MKVINITTNFLAVFIAILPILYTEKTLDPVVTLRFLVLSVLVLLMLVLRGKCLFSKEILKHPISITVFGLFLLALISVPFANYVFSEAIYHTLKLGVFFLLLLLFVKELKEDKSKLLKSSIIFVFLTSVLAIFQYVTAFFNDGFQKEIEFIAGTMANKNLLASVLFLGLPVSLYALLCLQSKVWKMLGIVSILLSVVIFFLIQSKAVFIALLIGLFSFIFLSIRSIKQFSFATLFIGVFTFLLYFGLGKIGLKENLFSDFKNLYNIKEETTKKNISLGARYFLYKNTVEIIKNNPVVGVGPGNWKIEIPKAGLYLTKGERGNTIVQRPHSDFLWVMSEMGILAGLLYVFLFLLVLRESYKLVKESDGQERIFYSAIFATIIGYMFISSVDFPLERIAHNVLLYLLIAIVISARLKNITNTVNYHRPIQIFCMIIAICSSYVGYARHQGEIHSTAAKLYKGKAHWQRIINEVDKAYKTGVYEIDRSSTPLHWYSGVAKFSLGKQEAAFKDFKQAYKLNPNHLHVLNNIATCYELKGERTKAIQYYKKALAISPRFEEASVNLSAVLYNENQYEEALDVLLRCNFAKDKKKYNRYLSVIMKSYLNNNFQLEEEQLIANNLMQLADDDPKKYMQQLINAYESRKKENKSYKELLISQLSL